MVHSFPGMHKLEAWAGFPFVPIFIAFYTDKNLALWEKPQFLSELFYSIRENKGSFFIDIPRGFTEVQIPFPCYNTPQGALG